MRWLFVITKVLAEMRDFTAKPAKDNILYTSLAERLGDVDEVGSATREQLLIHAEHRHVRVVNS